MTAAGVHTTGNGGGGGSAAYCIYAAAAPTATTLDRAASTCKFFPLLLPPCALRVDFSNSNQQEFRITQ